MISAIKAIAEKRKALEQAAIKAAILEALKHGDHDQSTHGRGSGAEGIASNSKRFADDGGTISDIADEETLMAAQFTLDDMEELDPDIAHKGTEFTKHAMGEPQSRVAMVEGVGVAGAVGYSPPMEPSDEEIEAGLTEPRVHVEYIGSTGIAGGTGSALMGVVIKEAAEAKAGITMEPENKKAEQFFEKLGMKRDPYETGSSHLMGLPAGEVSELAAGF
jgi:hypothetical protein